MKSIDSNSKKLILMEKGNPFLPNQPAYGSHFLGRETELQQIREEIHQQHFLLFGPRRIGKTSLLYQLREELQGKAFPLYISLQQFGTRDGKSLFEELFSTVMRELKGLNIISDSVIDSTEEAVRIIKTSHDKPLVLLIDEMGVGIEVDNFSLFLNKLRAVMQEVSSIRWVLSAGPFITEELVNPRSPLFNMVTHLPVTRLSSEAAERLLRLAEDLDILYEERTIEECLEWTGNFPLYLQIVGNHMYQTLKEKKTDERRVTQTLVKQIQQMMSTDKFEWERLWNIVTNIEEKAILALCAHHNQPLNIPAIKHQLEQITNHTFPYPRIRKAVDNLIWYGLLEHNNTGQYQITAGLIRNWLTTHLYYPEEIQDMLYLGAYHDNTRTGKIPSPLLQSYAAGY